MMARWCKITAIGEYGPQIVTKRTIARTFYPIFGQSGSEEATI
jgi:hypothetical protein